MVQPGQCPNRIGGSVEDQFSPLRAAGILHGEGLQARMGEKGGKLLDHLHRGVSGFKGTNPSITTDLETYVAWLDQTAGGESRTPDHVTHVVRQNFLVTHTILHGANGAFL